MNKAKEFLTKEWGEEFYSAHLHSNKTSLQLSMEDIYNTMEKYAKHRVKEIITKLSSEK